MSVLGEVTRQKISVLLDKPWFLPSILCVLINALGLFISFQLSYLPLETIFSISESRHSTILSIIASSLMTLIGVTFSISMLILTTVSNQFGPRLIPNFIQSKITQVTLGVFLGTFIFCLFSIYFESNEIIRDLQTIFAFVLTISCLFILVFFINVVINSIQIDGILSLVVAKTKTAIESGYLAHLEKNSIQPSKPDNKKIKTTFFSKTSGYVQAIDYDKIKSLAEKEALFIKIQVRAGDYIYTNDEILQIFSAEGKSLSAETSALITAAVNVINLRLLNQDLEYGFEQISEIAVRALSPGINDPYTARECVFLIGELLLHLANHRDLETCKLYDENYLRVEFKAFTYEGLVSAALSRLRQASLSDLTLILSIYDMIIQVTHLLDNKKLIKALWQQGVALKTMTQSQSYPDFDQTALSEREQQLEHIAKKHHFSVT